MRNITELHPRLQVKMEELKAACEAAGLKIGIGECLRTTAEQNALYAQGRTAPGSIVTNAPGSSYSSQHQWGIAFDFYRNDGTGAYNEDGNFFERVGAIGKSIGLGWGGDWTSIKDRPHLYLPDWGSTPKPLKAAYGTPEAFMATWDKGQTESPKPSSKPAPKPSAGGDPVIRNIQAWCNQYVGAGLVEDGIFGPKTKRALCRSLQRYHNIAFGSGLSEDGIWGPKTKAACRAAFGKSDLVYVAQAMLYCLKYGMCGSKGDNLDGQCGSGTRAAVTKYQQDHGLSVDGKCGRGTFGTMFS